MLQSLPSMLRRLHVLPIRSCSKAPGVFSSNYRYPASSPEMHFHRASPRDSSQVITPFVHVGTYPTRNYALRFLLAREGPYLSPDAFSRARGMTYGLSFESLWTKCRLLHTKVAWRILFTLQSSQSLHTRRSIDRFVQCVTLGRL